MYSYNHNRIERICHNIEILRELYLQKEKKDD